MTLADRLDALLTRPIYECDLETIREAAARLRALEGGRGAMTDIVGGTTGLGLVLYSGTRDELQTKLRARDDEIDRLRTERSELIEALTKLRFSAAVLLQNAEGCAVNHYGADYNLHGEPGWMADCRHPIENALLVLSKIKEQKA